ncbi:hypothetical protein SARC_05888 [Sphaeroforma arctica JP610]|uniref:Uncharacterized protein n=1 Tax=Sphaeroforma arctica JP610 TaxID=667725 RepID=A0A0L0G0S0_9EUKA|nr:hypothetical protein SARC_05888 [Sphaeroforma arctica JP610]KNC81803.1 hypothetical protein SARC_05888 [Sphaeroforma arctica JP610]|eukprot:XP_014155705.1 hypothetical protein SARC_05888 [Sphaeroforma arctica JP610]
MEAIYESYPGREDQLTSLTALLGYPEGRPSHVFVYGQPSVGKTAVTRTVVESLDSMHAYVDCIECFTPRMVYERAATQLYSQLAHRGSHAHDVAKVRCTNLDEFCARLTEISSIATFSGISTTFGPDTPVGIVLVFDNAERLRGSNDFAGILKISELAGVACNVCVVLISNLVWEKFGDGTFISDPLQVVFDNYTPEQANVILARQRPATASDYLYRGFVQVIWDVFSPACTDLLELHNIIKLLFPVYRDPIDSGLCTEYDTIKLYKFIEPYFKKALAKLYLKDIGEEAWAQQIQHGSEHTQRDTTDTEDERDDNAVDNASIDSEGEPVIVESQKSVRDRGKAMLEKRTKRVSKFVAEMDKMRHLDLPFYSRYLLTAAFLASNNPAKTDNHYFGAGNGRKAPRRKGGQRRQKGGSV